MKKLLFWIFILFFCPTLLLILTGVIVVATYIIYLVICSIVVIAGFVFLLVKVIPEKYRVRSIIIFSSLLIITISSIIIYNKIEEVRFNKEMSYFTILKVEKDKTSKRGEHFVIVGYSTLGEFISDSNCSGFNDRNNPKSCYLYKIIKNGKVYEGYEELKKVIDFIEIDTAYYFETEYIGYGDDFKYTIYLDNKKK